MVENSSLRGAAPEHFWRKSTASGNDTCVEVSFAGHAVLVRDSKGRTVGTLEFSGASWEILVEMVIR
jgi:hypothetical protein